MAGQGKAKACQGNVPDKAGPGLAGRDVQRVDAGHRFSGHSGAGT